MNRKQMAILGTTLLIGGTLIARYLMTKKNCDNLIDEGKHAGKKLRKILNNAQRNAMASIQH